MIVFMLDLSKTDNAIEEWGNKKITVYFSNIWYFKIIFILLIKVIIIYIRFF